MRRYNPKEIEPRWQKIWEESGIYKATEDKSRPKKYILEYFPYPSGAAMHVGHVRNYTIGDCVSRFMRMQGNNVLHPMGWDAFGLPAENYAIKTGISPQKAVSQNVQRFKKQLMQMGFSYDWSREVNSTDPDYYKWTQWFFLLLYKKGLAYHQESLQWWCPHDKTVLANEQVENGRCWRCGNLVEKKALKQWFFKITDYADRLDEDLEKLDWSPAIKAMQHNWIGRSRGAEVKFKIKDSEHVLKVFTTRPDTIFGATFLVVAPEHEILNKLCISDSHRQTIDNYIRTAERKSDIERQETEREKTGVFTGVYAVNPANGKEIPVWVADYVLPGYGTGAIMAVPGHDQRDYEFAKKFGLPVSFVVEPTYGQAQGDDIQSEKVFVALRRPSDNSIAVLNWGPRHKNWGGNLLIGGTVEAGEEHTAAAGREIAEETGYKNFKLVKEAEFKGHGYFFSNTKNINVHASGKGYLYDLVDEERAETKLDHGEKNKFTVSWQPASKVAAMLDDGTHEAMYRYLVLDEPYTGEGVMTNSEQYDGMDSSSARDKIIEDLAKKGIAKEKINYKIRDWLISRQRYWGAPIPMIHCGKCGIQPVPEKDLPVVLPELESYEPSGDGRSPLANAPEFVSVKCPACGGEARRETDTMDGFACSSWYFLRYADPRNDKQAFSRDRADFWLPVDDYIGGAEHAVMHLLYARFWTKVMFDDGLIDFDEPFTSLRNQGMILAPDGQKMSKSKGNTIEPDDLLEQGYGADSIRLMELFIGPWDQAVSWSVEGIGGTYRFLQRYWTLAEEFLAAPEGDSPEGLQITAQVHKTIKKVTEDLRRMDFNTAIAAMMELVNSLYKAKAEKGIGRSAAWRFALETLTQLLAPFAPHITEEVWEHLGHESSVHVSEWPRWDENLVTEEVITLAVQVNGKVRSQIVAAADISEQDAVSAAKSDEKVAPYIQGKEIKKAIYVPGRLVSLVV
ncbi:MAG TPA: leucine--tRNA ligase [Candidatus Saccharimonadales bacterium]|nr:leucine--tRNA ligase [Candidatus Saccharimonadales bacterium]